MKTVDGSTTGRSWWPVRVFRLGQEPGDDLTATTTAEARLQMVEALTLEAFSLVRREPLSYPRNQTPVSVRRLVARPPR